ncbi:transcriptional regulator [Kitasatospora sp. NPDC008050]|uniref:transcriptional regulator n=1 Tax=Kitasatospora sp. NPDC008050 TaxID=3364021 RepID=UPI0036EB94A3
MKTTAVAHRAVTEHTVLDEAAVARLADRRATGALHTETGTLFLQHGAVVHVESPRALGLGELLTGCGRITPDAWQHLVDRFAAEHLVGRLLVAQGVLTKGELEACAVAALHDAAYFALSPGSRRTGFEPGVRHWLGPVNAVTPRLLHREVVRRRLLLQRIWPWPQVDSAPVVRTGRTLPGTLPPGCRRREILEHADGRRTPAELARLLGRSSYATVLEVRRLAAAGLVATPPAAPSGSSAAGPVERPPRPVPPLPAPALPAPALPAPPLPDEHPLPLPHRTRGAPRCRAVPAADHPPSVHAPEIALLLRIRTALEARL